MMVIVPDSLHEAINAKLDAAYQEAPEAAVDREAHYAALLNYFNEHGHLPSFYLKKEEPDA